MTVDDARPDTAVARPLEFRRRPCDGDRVCPWRRDADLTVFTDGDMARLTRAQGGVPDPSGSTEVDAQRLTTAPQMACHKDQADTAHPLRLCAGWLAVVGPDHIGVRIAMLTGRLPVEAVYPPDRDQWPALHTSLTELLASRTHQLTNNPAGDLAEDGEHTDVC
ncbi:DUF6283 family protein [Actinomadura kijaniata]|uniref:DUF6283 family protein n=1 Tax=Actinomadura kijaniata TaxID=46161 RepID=UPI003F1BAC63